MVNCYPVESLPDQLEFLRMPNAFVPATVSVFGMRGTSRWLVREGRILKTNYEKEKRNIKALFMS